MDVSCSIVTVHVADFPYSGVPVTLAVQVGDQPVITNVVNINSSTTQVTVDIERDRATLRRDRAGDRRRHVDAQRPEPRASSALGHVRIHDDHHEWIDTTTGTSTSTTTTTTRSTTTTTKPKPTTTTTTTTRPTTTTTTTTTIPANVTADLFQVELRRCTQVHEGYEHFPAGTVVHWRVEQTPAVITTGSFTTVAGHGYHFITQSLGQTLEASPNTAKVHYHWTIHRTAEHVTYTREPGCSGTTPSGASSPADIFGVTVKSCRTLHFGYQYFPRART